jgi:hypothetical protein
MKWPWFGCPLEAWVALRDTIPKPWPEMFAVVEVRWWENQVRRGYQSRLPSRRELEKLFDWSAHKVDKFRKSPDWLPDSKTENPYLKTARR